MKRLVISCILILALTNLAYAMGSHHGGGGSHATVSSSGGSSGSGSTGSGSESSVSVSNSGTGITPPNGPTGGNTDAVGGQGSPGGGPIMILSSSSNGPSTGGNTGAVGGQGSTEGGPIILVSSSPNSSSTTCVPVPELTPIFLLGSALLGLWGVRRKIKR
jgi:hypothetical protein